MIDKDLSAYAAAAWGQYLTPVTELSKEKANGTPLVRSALQMYDFDEICASMFPEDKRPASADGLEITSHEIRFIEFKSGFRKKITRENFDAEKGRCEKTGEICEDYWAIFFQNQIKETAGLIASIRFKALESYLALEQRLLPLCPEAVEPLRLVFVVVADVDAVDGMVDILTDLSQKKSSCGSLEQIRSSLRKYAQIEDVAYCYDRIEVLTPAQYASRVGGST